MKKQYIIPSTETMDLRAMKATMESPLFGPASMASDSFKGTAPAKREEPF